MFTGGTIGSHVKENGYIAPKENVPYELIEEYQKEHTGDVEFVIEEPFCILSENLTSKELNHMITNIKKTLLEECVDGIILTHGTDTLQYSAAILSYVFGGSDIPILLVSSDFPLADKRANGHSNFLHAVKFIEGQYGTGVFVSYCNQEGNPTIHRGAKLLQHKAFSGDVESIGNNWYGIFEQDIFLLQAERKTYDKSEESSQKESMFSMEEKAELSLDAGEILRIVPYVGMQYPTIPQGVKAILHESYHSGTIGINDQLRTFADRAKEREIPIYITGLTKKESTYETVEEYEKIGIIPLFDVTPISQYCKLWLAISNHKNIKQVMEQRFPWE